MYPQLLLLKKLLFVHEIQLRLEKNRLFCSLGLLLITAYTGRFCLKGVLFLGFRYVKGYGIHLLRYMKGQGNLSMPSVKSAFGDSLVHQHHQPPVWPECVFFSEALVHQAGLQSYRQHSIEMVEALISYFREHLLCLDLPGVVQWQQPSWYPEHPQVDYRCVGKVLSKMQTKEKVKLLPLGLISFRSQPPPPPLLI